MLRQLRRKFIAINMILVSVVLLAVLSIQLFSSWRKITQTTDEALRRAVEWGENGPDHWQVAPPQPNGENNSNRRGQPLFVPVFCVDIIGDTVFLTENNLTVSEEVLTAAVEGALAGRENVDNLPDLTLRYMRVQSPDGLRIVFADTTWQDEAMRQQVSSALLVVLSALVGFLLVSIVLARWATRPTERSWKQQQQFVADASHELKTPLTVMLADTDILLAHPEETVESQRKWVEYIRDEALGMKGLVEDLLFLARSDGADRPDAPKTAVPLSDLCWNSLLSFEPLAFERGARLTPAISPDLFVSGHEDQLRRLVNILLDNACKYCGGEGDVTLTLEQTGNRVSLRVHNTGTPIPPESIPHLFERFYRVDKARSREEGGYGLGLSIAATIAAGHGGGISVTSGKDGTCFTVTLPV